MQLQLCEFYRIKSLITQQSGSLHGTSCQEKGKRLQHLQYQSVCNICPNLITIIQLDAGVYCRCNCLFILKSKSSTRICKLRMTSSVVLKFLWTLTALENVPQQSVCAMHVVFHSFRSLQILHSKMSTNYRCLELLKEVWIRRISLNWIATHEKRNFYNRSTHHAIKSWDAKHNSFRFAIHLKQYLY